ncbi:MAG: MFS transporter [Candidatus Micrarchaeia archaeon]
MDLKIDIRFRYLLASRALRSIALIYMSLAFSLYLAALHISIINIGIVAAATMLFMIFLTMLLGYIGDRKGYKKEVILAEALAFLGALIIGISTYPWLVITGMIIAGLSGSAGGMRGAFSPGTNALIAGSYSDERERMRKYSFITMTASGSAVGGSILFSSVSFIEKSVGLVEAYRLLYIASALMLFISMLFLFMLNEAKRPEKTTRMMKASSMKYSLRVITANTLGGIGMGIFMPLLPLWFKLMYNASTFKIGIVFTSVYIATAFGSYLSSRMAHKLDAINTASYTRLASGILLFCMAISPLLVIAGIIYIVRALIAGFGSPSRTTVSVRGIDAEDYGTATSVQGIASRMAQLSSVASGYAMDYALPLPIVIGGIFQLASGISYKLLFKKSKAIAKS